jgi:hypothetical protein
VGRRVLFVIAVVVAIGAIVAGRLFSMPHASKADVVSIVVVFLCAIAYMVLPGLIDSLWAPVASAPSAATSRPRVIETAWLRRCSGRWRNIR